MSLNLINIIFNSKIFRIIVIFIFLISFLIILASSVINIYEKRSRISSFFKHKTQQDYSVDYIISKQKKLAKDIITNGGYILLFRHAEREKWIDVKKYDSIEVLNNLNAENEYFSKAVCLNDRGLVQARAIGEIIKKIKIPYHVVVSSPSCRARQTAELAFGGYDYIRNIFMHYGPFNDDKKIFIQNVKKEILKIEVKENSNAIISAHNGVIKSTEIFDKIETNMDFSEIGGKFMEEGGFIVMKNENGKLVFVNLFYRFHNFYETLFDRPED